MRIFALLLISALSLASSSAFAASYQRNDGTIIDPIQSLSGGNLAYVGNNLETGADLTVANLADANLDSANLTGANLQDANLTGADLSNASLDNANLADAHLFNANLTGANLESANLSNANLADANLDSALLFGANLDSANLTGADLTVANLTGAILANAVGLGDLFGAALYNINTDFTGTGFDPVAAGWMLVPVPETGTALLMGLGLAGLASRRR